MIKAICFDLDGVYFTKTGMEAFIKSLVAMGSDEDLVRQAIFKSDKMKLFKQGKISEMEYWGYVNEFINLNLSVEEYSKILVQNYEINQEVHEFILKIKTAGYKTCFCTNNFETRIRELNKKFDFLKNFDVQVISYKVGVLKPEKRIFEELVGQSGVLAEEVVYSDDNEDKLQGAIELGILTFVYKNFDQFKNKLFELGFNL